MITDQQKICKHKWALVKWKRNMVYAVELDWCKKCSVGRGEWEAYQQGVEDTAKEIYEELWMGKNIGTRQDFIIPIKRFLVIFKKFMVKK